MFIQTEVTPNPQSLKFIPGVTVSSQGPMTFSDEEEAKISILAQKLLNIKDVKSVFFGMDFITVTKNDKIDWDVLKPEILVTIMDHVISGLPMVEGSGTSELKTTSNEDDSAIVQEIKEIIETRVRPAVAQDGGDISFVEFTKEGIVMLELKGACSGCPSSTITLKNGIENMLMHFVPEVKGVESI